MKMAVTISFSVENVSNIEKLSAISPFREAVGSLFPACRLAAIVPLSPSLKTPLLIGIRGPWPFCFLLIVALRTFREISPGRADLNGQLVHSLSS